MHFRKPSPRKHQPDENQPSLLRTPRNQKFWTKKMNYIGHERPQLAYSRVGFYLLNEREKFGTLIFPAGRPNHRIRTVLEHYDFRSDKSILRSR